LSGDRVAANFDVSHQIEISGSFTELRLINPHSSV
jgi:hypothetical protein